MLSVSYLSDLHLEFIDYHDFKKEKGGDVLLLAGDITTAKMMKEDRTDKDARSHDKYMQRLKSQLVDKYEYVFYVMGNHEHYGWDFNHTREALLGGLAYHGMSKVKILDNDATVLDDTLFIGCTLWTDFNKGNETDMHLVDNGMNDFRIISTASGHRFTTQLAHQEHQKSLTFIRLMLNEIPNKNVVMVTHHGPTMKSCNSRHMGNSLDYGYCSDLSEFIIDNPRIKYWVHGHTHENFDYEVGSCRVLANQRGYHFESSAKNFTGTKSFEI